MHNAPIQRASRVLLLLAALFIPRPVLAGEVWHVGGENVGAQSLAEVLAGARGGDFLLLAPGVHTVDALLGYRSLTLIGSPGARLRGQVTITGNDPDVSIHFVGLTLEGTPWLGLPALTVRDYAGRTWLQDCTLFGSDPYDAPYPPLAEASEALRVVHANEVVLASCILFGGPAAPTEQDGLPPASGAAAVHCAGSRIALFDCSLRGGDGGSDAYDVSETAGEGGAAFYQRSGARSFLWQSRLRGGDGGRARSGRDGSGGTGLHHEGWSVEARALRIDGGLGSERGLRTYQTGGPLRDWRAWPREMLVSSLHRDDGWLTVVARGVPGESVVLELALESRWHPGRVPADSAPEMLAVLGREFSLGLIPPTGMIVRRFPLGALPPGEGSAVFAQLRHESQHGVVRTPAALLVSLDADL